jgi:hypothetical protein
MIRVYTTTCIVFLLTLLHLDPFHIAVASMASLQRTAVQAARGPLEFVREPVPRAVLAAPARHQLHLTLQQPTPQALWQLPLLLLMQLLMLLPRRLPCPWVMLPRQQTAQLLQQLQLRLQPPLLMLLPPCQPVRPPPLLRPLPRQALKTNRQHAPLHVTWKDQ